MQQAKIYVGNLSYDTTSDDLRDLFSQYGNLVDVKLITDRTTGRSKGFAFIEFENAEVMEKALAVNGTEFQGRQLRVNPAKPEGSRGRR